MAIIGADGETINPDDYDDEEDDEINTGDTPASNYQADDEDDTPDYSGVSSGGSSDDDDEINVGDPDPEDYQAGSEPEGQGPGVVVEEGDDTDDPRTVTSDTIDRIREATGFDDVEAEDIRRTADNQFRLASDYIRDRLDRGDISTTRATTGSVTRTREDPTGADDSNIFTTREVVGSVTRDRPDPLASDLEETELDRRRRELFGRSAQFTDPEREIEAAVSEQVGTDIDLDGGDYVINEDGSVELTDAGRRSVEQDVALAPLDSLVGDFEESTGIDVPGEGPLAPEPEESDSQLTTAEYGRDYSEGFEPLYRGAEYVADTVTAVAAPAYGEELAEPAGEIYEGVIRSPVSLISGGVDLTQAVGSTALGSAEAISRSVVEDDAESLDEFIGRTSRSTQRGVFLAAGGLTAEARDNPLRLTGEAVGSLGASGAIFRAASSAGRAGATVRLAVQPGEELLGVGGFAVTRRLAGRDRAQQLFPNQEPVLFSEETAIRAARAGASRVSGAIDDANIGTPRQELISARFAAAEARVDFENRLQTELDTARDFLDDDRGQAAISGPPRPDGGTILEPPRSELETEQETDTPSYTRPELETEQETELETEQSIRSELDVGLDEEQRLRTELGTELENAPGELFGRAEPDSRIRPRFDFEVDVETNVDTEEDTRFFLETEQELEQEEELETELEVEVETETELEANVTQEERSRFELSLGGAFGAERREQDATSAGYFTETLAGFSLGLDREEAVQTAELTDTDDPFEEFGLALEGEQAASFEAAEDALRF